MIAGFTRPRDGRRRFFGSLVLGIYEDGCLVYVGRTGTRLGEKTLDLLHREFQPLITSECPFAAGSPLGTAVVWLKPKLVCEVSYLDRTKEGILRRPSFRGLRAELPAARGSAGSVPLRLIRNEGWKGSSDGRPVRPSLLLRDARLENLELTHLDRLYWPREEISKGDLLAYYRAICPVLLPHLKDRKHSLFCHPQGIEKRGIGRKRRSAALCQDEEGLLKFVNLGGIEIAPWSSRVQFPERPDYLVIDLVPEGVSFDKVVEAALALRGVLEVAGVDSYCKTSGAAGLQVYVPLGAEYDYDQARQFAEIIATLVHHKLPASTGLPVRAGGRRKRVYLDYLRNRSGQALAAPYSVRPFPGATVSTPLEWSEIGRGLDPTAFTMKTVFRRLEKLGDLFAPVLEKTADLELALQKLARAEG